MLARTDWRGDDYPHTNEFGKQYHAILGSSWAPGIHPIAIIDLELAPEQILREMRQTTRHGIRWGREHMLWNTSQDIASMREFHAKIAGRVTRGPESWDLMQEEIRKGRGDILYGFLNDELVAASAFIDGNDVSIYWSGVYDRSLFPKPIAHYGLWLAIQRARLRGRKIMEIGEVPEKGTVSEKEYNIGVFKRGFARQMVN